MTSNESTSFYESLFEICQAMVSPLGLDAVLKTILDLATKTLHADAGSILLYDAKSENLKMLAAKGLPPGVIQRGHISRKGSIAEWVIEHNEPLVVNSEAIDRIRKNDSQGERVEAIRSALCVPLRAKGEIIGTLNLNRYRNSEQPYSDADLHTVMILASQAAVVIENARLQDESVRQVHLAAIGQTVAGISHCIKNMLTGLRGGLGLIEMAGQNTNWDLHAKGAGVLRRNIDRISLLVLDMLDYSRERRPSRQATSVETLIDDVFDTVRYKCEQKSVRLEREVAPDASRIQVDTDQVFRCLLNLVENAIDAIPNEGCVKVRCAPVPDKEIASELGGAIEIGDPGSVVRLTVEDSGEGILPENLQTIFEPFFSTKASKGTGLGLACTRKIVEEHGGCVRVESEIGQGTRFHLILPERSPNDAGELRPQTVES
ncbi:GAF domain-containing protein [Candidatus Sumerlaeota bacterium]|nr:GAF domain-containing protein [Candidatus Sumerlaeota bacterium]